MITYFFRTIIFIVFIVFSFVFLRAQDHIQFRNYTIDEGLSQSSVSSVIQDRLGALWIGTQDGINRFNGKNFEVFTADKGYDISNEYINVGYHDSYENLWFGTRNGLVKHNPRTVDFSSYLLDSTENIALDIHAISEDLKGNILVGTGYGNIYIFTNKDKQFKLIDNTTFSTKIIGIKYTNNKVFFISDNQGVIVTDKNYRNKKHILFKDPYDNLTINKIIDYKNSDLLLATNHGLFSYNESSGFIEPFSQFYSYLKDININDAVYLSENRLLIASENSGLYQLEEVNGKVNIINHTADIFKKGSLLSNYLNGLFLDNKGIVWVFSEFGLSSYTPNFVGFKGVGISAYPEKGLPSQNVWGFDESEDEKFLYIAGDHGVSMYDRLKKKFYHYFLRNKEGEDISTLNIKYVNDSLLLIGSTDGLYELTIDNQNYSKYKFNRIEQSLDVSNLSNFIYKIIPFEKENQFLIGTKGGILFYDIDNDIKKYLYNDGNENKSIGAGACRFIFEDENNFYTSPSTGGLYKIKLEDNTLKAYLDNDFSFLNKNKIDYFTCVYKEDEDTYWFGTMGNGIYKVNKKTSSYKRFDKSNGLPNNVVYGIEGVKTNNKNKYIWISTNKGVVALNTKSEKVYNFTEKDGLMSNELNQGGSFVSKNGEIYFGGIHGYNYFDPLAAFQINNKIHVFFSDLEIDNELILPSEEGILQQSIAFTRKIVLPYYKRTLKLRFFADDLSNPDRIEYKYILTGKNNIEEELGSTNELRFSSLSPGTYELTVYAKISNGEWSKYPARLTIELERPFWLEWWFYAISVIFISMIIFIVIRRRIEESRRRRVRLEMKIAERTRELRKKNEQIQQQRNQLIKQTEELEREKEKSERILNNVLPKETAKELKKDGRAAAREFKKVSIMFTDFVGFSRISEGMSAKELVSILDTHFSKFDEIIEKNNLEKIKTIGDAYMAAGGVPIRNKTNPINTALAAIQIQNYMRQQKEKNIKEDKPYWTLRIGINTGSVSAGVIGTKRYAYDIWGSAVNRAQRMEELCEPEKIAITQATYDHISPYFVCKEVGKVKTKSGIKIYMFELISIKPELSINGLGVEPNESFHKLVNLHFYSTINYVKAERFILAKLKKELDPKLHYHSYAHSKDVTRQAERIAISEGITDEDLFLLKSAASYHDAGFIEKYDKNEKIGARMAEEILPEFGYTKEHIERIKELIYITEVPHKPKNLLEKIICDADLDYLGRDDFFEISDRLRQELKEHNKIKSDREWDLMQVKFFEMHHYFTKTSIETRLEKKKKHLKMIKQRLEKDEYED